MNHMNHSNGKHSKHSHHQHAVPGSRGSKKSIYCLLQYCVKYGGDDEDTCVIEAYT